MTAAAIRVFYSCVCVYSCVPLTRLKTQAQGCAAQLHAPGKAEAGIYWFKQASIA